VRDLWKVEFRMAAIQDNVDSSQEDTLWRSTNAVHPRNEIGQGNAQVVRQRRFAAADYFGRLLQGTGVY
jgi:hypothetical protein